MGPSISNTQACRVGHFTCKLEYHSWHCTASLHCLFTTMTTCDLIVDIWKEPCRLILLESCPRWSVSRPSEACTMFVCWKDLCGRNIRLLSMDKLLIPLSSDRGIKRKWNPSNTNISNMGIFWLIFWWNPQQPWRPQAEDLWAVLSGNLSPYWSHHLFFLKRQFWWLQNEANT